MMFRSTLVSVFVVVGFMYWPCQVSAAGRNLQEVVGFAQQGPKMTATGVHNSAYQGSSISLSGDGNTAIVGGYLDDEYHGAAWIFTRSLGEWSQRGLKLVGLGGVDPGFQGFAVAMSSDGTTAIMGGLGDFNRAAWIFSKSENDDWIQQGPKLAGTGAIGSSSQGRAVSISSDGNTVIVGGNSDAQNTGAAWVFTRTNGAWTQQGSKLVGTGAVGSSQQGVSVSLSGDGNTAVVGGPEDNSTHGAVWIFTRANNTWTQQGSKLVGSGAVGNAQQGRSVSISSDGNTVVVGGPKDDSGQGAAWVFTRNVDVWTQQESKLVANDAEANAKLGTSVSVSGNGSSAIIGSNYDDSGARFAWIFTRTGGTWTQQGSKLVGTGASNTSQPGGSTVIQGESVSISSDGNTAMVGSPADDVKSGAVWVFTQINEEWSQEGSKLVGTGAVSRPRLGVAVSLSDNGSTAVVGGYGDGFFSGAAWIFTRSDDDGEWTEHAKLYGTGASGEAYQGSAVALSGDGQTAVVAGVEDADGVGAAWIFVRSNIPDWRQQAKLTGNDVVGFASQGISVAISGDGNTVIVGGNNDNLGKGAAWIYVRTGEDWAQQGAKLVANDVTGNLIAQGCAVSLSHDGNTAIVGGKTDNSFIGAAWVYTRTNGVWSQQGPKLVGTGASDNAVQGSSVAISGDGNTAIIGGPGDRVETGAVWVFTRSNGAWTQQGPMLVGSGSVGSRLQQGLAVAISGDGNIALVGGPNDGARRGATWVYTRSSAGLWRQRGAKVVGTGSFSDALQGSAVALSRDGKTGVVGGRTDDFNHGAVWFFANTFNASDPAPSDPSSSGTSAIRGLASGGSAFVCISVLLVFVI